MAENKTPSLGIASSKGGYHECLRQVGKQNGNGDTVAIAYFSFPGFHILALLIRTLVLIGIISLIFIQNPLRVIPDVLIPESFQAQMDQWEAFAFHTWALALALYIAYYIIALYRNGFYKGQPGADIHFTRYGKVVKTVKEGERAIIIDPRIRPSAIISTKPMRVDMPQIEARTQENITLFFNSAILLMVKDSYRLFAQGGFPNFLSQLTKLYESSVKDRALRVTARDFVRFGIAPVAIAMPEGHQSVTEKLGALEVQNMTVELLEDMAGISELDISALKLQDDANALRTELLEAITSLADSYGIEILDVVPQGNLVANDYLEQIALPLITTITRLEQASIRLSEITKTEFSEEIDGAVGNKKLAVLKIERIIKRIKAVVETLKKEETQQSIISAKTAAMQDVQQRLLVEVLTQLEAMEAQALAQEVDSASIERYLTELTGIMDTLTAAVPSMPKLDLAVVDSMRANVLDESFDVVDWLLKKSGTKDALDRLSKEVDASAKTDVSVLHEITTQINQLQIDTVVSAIDKDLAEHGEQTGISIEEYTPEIVLKQVEAIFADASLSTSDAEKPEVVS